VACKIAEVAVATLHRCNAATVNSASLVEGGNNSNSKFAVDYQANWSQNFNTFSGKAARFSMMIESQIG